MTDHDSYILDIIHKAEKTEFDSNDFPQTNPDVMHKAILNLKHRGFLNFTNASSDSGYEYINVSITKIGLMFHASN